jgi:hypothetical protein
LRRLFLFEPELNPAPVGHLPSLFAFLQPLIYGAIFVAFMWAIGQKTGDRHKAKLDWAIYLFLLLFLSSQPAVYHFAALILSAVLLIDFILARHGKTIAFIAVVLYILICAATIQLPWTAVAGWHNLLVFPRLLFMTVLGGVMLWISFSESTLPLRAHTVAIALSTVIAIVAVGFYSTRNHLHAEFDNYKARVICLECHRYVEQHFAFGHDPRRLHHSPRGKRFNCGVSSPRRRLVSPYRFAAIASVLG